MQSATLSAEEKANELARIEHLRTMDHQENSYIGHIGKAIEPILRPLGFDWKISVSLLSGMAAKEIVVSTLSVLYTGDADDEQGLSERLANDRIQFLEMGVVRDWLYLRVSMDRLIRGLPDR